MMLEVRIVGEVTGRDFCGVGYLKFLDLGASYIDVLIL